MQKPAGTGCAHRRGEGEILAAVLAAVFAVCLIIGMCRLPREISLEPVHAVSIVMPKLDLNKASAEELCALPGIGELLAERILEYRAEHGGFADVRQLTEVEGIGEGKFEAVRDLVCVG